MIAVIYMPSAGDAGAGPIVQTIQGSEATVAATAAAIGGTAVEVDQLRDDYDAAFHVAGGAVVAL